MEEVDEEEVIGVAVDAVVIVFFLYCCLEVSIEGVEVVVVDL